MVVGKMVGLLILWVGVAMYPLADDDDARRLGTNSFKIF